jgi:hypothetical protein
MKYEGQGGLELSVAVNRTLSIDNNNLSAFIWNINPLIANLIRLTHIFKIKIVIFNG